MVEFLIILLMIVICVITGILCRRWDFFRDADDYIIGGVCCGLSRTLKIQPFWFRLGFALAILLSGYGLCMYIVLWIALPVKARP